MKMKPMMNLNMRLLDPILPPSAVLPSAILSATLQLPTILPLGPFPSALLSPALTQDTLYLLEATRSPGGYRPSSPRPLPTPTEPRYMNYQPQPHSNPFEEVRS